VKIDDCFFPDPAQYYEARLEEAQFVMHIDPLEAGIRYVGFPVPEEGRDENGDPEFVYFDVDYVFLFARMGLNLFFLPDYTLPAVLTEECGEKHEMVGLLMPITWGVSNFKKPKIVAKQQPLVFDYIPTD